MHIPCTMISVQDGNRGRHYVFVPYDCFYHVYDQAGMYKCAVQEKVDWILTMGDSQEREFVAIMKNINGSKAVGSATKFENVLCDPLRRIRVWSMRMPNLNRTTHAATCLHVLTVMQRCVTHSRVRRCLRTYRYCHYLYPSVSSCLFAPSSPPHCRLTSSCTTPPTTCA